MGLCYKHDGVTPLTSRKKERDPKKNKLERIGGRRGRQGDPFETIHSEFRGVLGDREEKRKKERKGCRADCSFVRLPKFTPAFPAPPPVVL